MIAAALGFCLVGFLLVALPWLFRSRVGRAGGVAPAGAWEALERVMDPELVVSVVDLGLVREVGALSGGRVEARIVLTSPTCPYGGLIVSEIRRALESVPGVSSARVTVDSREVWTPELASPEIRKHLGLGAESRR